MARLVIVEHSMNAIKWPAMRREIIGALAELADREYQDRAWIHQQFDVAGQFSDFDLMIHILYDDTQVLPDPQSAVGALLFAGESAALLQLEAVLTPVLDRLGDSPVGDYLTDAEWPAVVSAASVALATMVRHRSVE